MTAIKKSISSFLLIILVSGTVALAQEAQQVSDEEMKQFTSSIQQVEIVNQEAQIEMAEAVQKEGLEVQRYNEMQQAVQDPNQEIDATDEELQKYETATQELAEIHTRSQQKMQDKIIEEGLTVNRYQEIASIIRGDLELQQQLREYLED